MFLATQRRICRHGDMSLTNKTKELKMTGAGEFCKFNTFNNQDNPGNAVLVQDYSMCGFNKDNSGWYQILNYL